MAKILIALYVLTTSSALIALKWGAKAGSLITYVNYKVHLNLNLYTFLGVSLYGFSFLLYTFLISKYDLGYIIPLTTAFVYILIFAGSYLVFRENFTVPKIIGIILVLCGIVFLNLKSA